MEKTIEIQTNQELLKKLDALNEKFVNNNELDTILKRHELELLQLIKINNGDQEHLYNHIEKQINKLSYFKKYKLYINKYISYSILLALKLVSKDCTPNEGYIDFYKKAYRVAGDFKIYLKLSIPSKLEEKPWIDFHHFSNTEPIKNYTKTEPFQNQDMTQFDFHTCLVNKYTYALGKGGDFICGGCAYQQDFISNTAPTNDIYNNLATWTNSLMSPFELEKYLNLVFEKNN